MSRAAPILAHKICTHSDIKAWCFPGGPPASECPLAQDILAMAKRGDIRVYSTSPATYKPAEVDWVQEYIQEVAGKLTPCTKSQCPNKTNSDPLKSPYIKQFRECDVWRTGTELLQEKTVQVRGGMGPDTHTVEDGEAMVAHLSVLLGNQLGSQLGCQRWDCNMS